MQIFLPDEGRKEIREDLHPKTKPSSGILQTKLETLHFESHPDFESQNSLLERPQCLTEIASVIVLVLETPRKRLLNVGHHPKVNVRVRFEVLKGRVEAVGVGENRSEGDALVEVAFVNRDAVRGNVGLLIGPDVEAQTQLREVVDFDFRGTTHGVTGRASLM